MNLYMRSVCYDDVDLSRGFSSKDVSRSESLDLGVLLSLIQRISPSPSHLHHASQ